MMHGYAAVTVPFGLSLDFNITNDLRQVSVGLVNVSVVSCNDDGGLVRASTHTYCMHINTKIRAIMHIWAMNTIIFTVR